MSDESLSDFPRVFQEREPMPWEMTPCATRWQWGLDAGKLLTEIDSKELLRKRRWLAWRDPENAYFGKIIAEIDAVLQDRMGE